MAKDKDKKDKDTGLMGWAKEVMEGLRKDYNPTDKKVKRALKEAGVD